MEFKVESIRERYFLLYFKRIHLKTKLFKHLASLPRDQNLRNARRNGPIKLTEIIKISNQQIRQTKPIHINKYQVKQDVFTKKVCAEI